MLGCGRCLYPDLIVSPSDHLPGTVKTKIISFGEHSHGAYKVALVMSDGTIVEDVVVAWGDEVVSVAGFGVHVLRYLTGRGRHRPELTRRLRQGTYTDAGLCAVVSLKSKLSRRQGSRVSLPRPALRRPKRIRQSLVAGDCRQA